MSAERSLKRCGLSEPVLTLLQTHHFQTCKDVLYCDKRTLQEVLDLPASSAEELLFQVSQAACPEPKSVLALERTVNSRCIPTQLSLIDKALHGGIPPGVITEIVGATSIGKTQLCHTLLVQNDHHLGGSSVLVDTEGTFYPKRTLEIAQRMYPDCYSQESQLNQLAAKITIFKPQTSSELLEILSQLEEFVISNRVSLLVLDSIAALVQKEFSATVSAQLVLRQQLLAKEASLLKYLAESFSIPVVVTNRVMTSSSSSSSSSTSSGPHRFASGAYPGNSIQEGTTAAALGTVWSHSVNVRLVLEDRGAPSDENPPQSIRFLRIAKSPLADNILQRYAITSKGFTAVGIVPTG